MFSIPTFGGRKALVQIPRTSIIFARFYFTNNILSTPQDLKVKYRITFSDHLFSADKSIAPQISWLSKQLILKFDKIKNIQSIRKKKKEPDPWPPALLGHLLKNHVVVKTSRQYDTQFSLRH